MWLSHRVPRVTVQRRMLLTRVIGAREAAAEQPSWMAIFLKAYALLAQEIPEFRRAFVKLPWPQLYEYPESVAAVAHEREYLGEMAVLITRIKAPARHSIAELNAMIRSARSKPVMDVKEFRQALTIARAPAPIRRFLMWFALNFGRQRPNFFGTFGLSVYSALGSESFNPISPVTTVLNYGPIDSEGGVSVRIIYDHRVMDGATVARALERLEVILNGAVAAELRASGASEQNGLGSRAGSSMAGNG